jgi:hypothetical protein
VGNEGGTRIEFRCSPFYQHTAWYPVIEHLQRLLQFERDEPPHAKLEKLAQALTRYRFPQADTVPLLAALLSLPHPDGYPALNLSPQRQRQKTHGNRTSSAGKTEELHQVGDAPAGPLAFDFQ